MEEEILISGWHSCTVLMVLMVKERRALVEGRDVEQWSIGGIVSVVGAREKRRCLEVQGLLPIIYSLFT